MAPTVPTMAKTTNNQPIVSSETSMTHELTSAPISALLHPSIRLHYIQPYGVSLNHFASLKLHEHAFLSMQISYMVQQYSKKAIYALVGKGAY